MRRAKGLEELGGEYDSLLCDVWGVLHNGVNAFPAAVDALLRFRATVGPVALITNGPRPAPQIRLQLRRLGVPDEAYDRLISSGDVTRTVISEHPGAKLLHIGPDRDLPLFEGLDAAFASEDEAEIVVCTGLVDDTSERPDDYRPLLERLLARRLVMVCANPDIVVERGGELVYCAGALARLYSDMGGEAVLVGKPYAPIYDAAKHQLAQLGGKRILAVGDGLPTDVRGAVENGISVLFVTGGIHATEFGPPDTPDAARVAARLNAEGLQAVAYLPALSWNGAGSSA